MLDVRNNYTYSRKVCNVKGTQDVDEERWRWEGRRRWRGRDTEGRETEMGRETDRGGDRDRERKMEMWRSVSKLVGPIVGLIKEAARIIDEKITFLVSASPKRFLASGSRRDWNSLSSCDFYEFILQNCTYLV